MECENGLSNTNKLYHSTKIKNDVDPIGADSVYEINSTMTEKIQNLVNPNKPDLYAKLKNIR